MPVPAPESHANEPSRALGANPTPPVAVIPSGPTPQATAPTDRAADASRARRHVTLVALVALAVYANALVNGFVFDDIPQILKNPWITDFRHLPDIFLDNVWGFIGERSNYYRPLMHLSYMLTYALFGFSAWAFHLMNVLLHLGVSVLVYLVAGRLLRERSLAPVQTAAWIPLAIALLFTTHPIHTEVVTAVMGIPDLSMALFYLLALYFYIRPAPLRPRDLALSLAAFFLATLSKEPALTLPVLLIAYDAVVRRGPLLRRANLARYAAYAGVIALYFALRTVALGNPLTARRHAILQPQDYAINALPLFAQYIEKLVLPVKLNFLHTFDPITSLRDARGIVGTLLVIGFAGLSFVVFRRSAITFIGLLLVAFPLAPALYLPALNQDIENAFAERYLYLPSVGFVLIVGAALRAALFRRPRLRVTLVAIFVAVTTLYSLGTVQRNTVWKNSTSLFADALAKSPTSAVPHLFFGYALLNEKGDVDGAIAEYETALRLRPHSYDALNKLGIAYFRKGWVDKSIAAHAASIEENPEFGAAHNNLALAYFAQGWLEMAIRHYTIALELNPRFVEAHNNLGLAFYRQGRVREAMKEYRTTLALNSRFDKAHNNLGVAYAEMGDLDNAIFHFEEALRLNASDPNARENLATARAARSRRGHDRPGATPASGDEPAQDPLR